MYPTGISPVTRRSLAILSQNTGLSHFYLAGGTACALRLGHRLSYDLDFFTPLSFDQKELSDWMSTHGKFKLDQIKKDTLLGIFEKTNVSFFTYRYALIGKTEDFDGMAILGEPDLAAMKVDAISSRGTKRDFIDLYFLGKNIPLAEALRLYQQKYRRQNLNLAHTMRALAYFTDADNQDPPEMLKSCDWGEVKAYFLQEVSRVFDLFLANTK